MEKYISIFREKRENIYKKAFLYIEMSNQRIISFDVGIKNMAYCIFDFHPSQPDSLNIMDWNVLNLMEKEEPHFFCNCTNVKTKTKKPKKEKKVKLIDTFLKTDLEKIAKKNDVSLKTRDGKLKTKEQLFNSLKRKNLI